MPKTKFRTNIAPSGYGHLTIKKTLAQLRNN